MHANTHLSYYTALSRSVTAEGTAIMQGFDLNKITRGIWGELQQMLRDLHFSKSHSCNQKGIIIYLQFKKYNPLSTHLHVFLKKIR